MILQLKIVTWNPTDYSEIQADSCSIGSRILFRDINLCHSFNHFFKPVRFLHYI